jgi:hypothetical protein
MPNSTGTLQQIGSLLTAALRPLQDALRTEESFKGLIYRLGWNASALPPQYATLGTAIAAAADKLDSLGDNPSPADILDLVDKAVAAFNAVQSITVAPAGVDAGAFLAEINERLFELLLTDLLSAEFPAAYNVLMGLNVVRRQVSPSSPGRPAFVRTVFDWNALLTVITDPGSLPQQVFGWGTAEVDTDKIIDLLARLADALRFPIALRVSDDALLEGYVGTSLIPLPTTKALDFNFFSIPVAGKDVDAGFTVRPLPPSGASLPGIAIEPRIPSEFPLTLNLADDIKLRLRAGTNTPDLLGITIRPGAVAMAYPLKPGTPPPAAGIGVGFDFSPKDPVVLFGEATGTRLQFQGGSVDLSADFRGSGLEVSVGADLAGLTLILSPGETDGFMRKIVGDADLSVAVPLGVQWSSVSGVTFKGSAAFEVALASHLSLGPIQIDQIVVRLAVMTDTQPKIALEVGAGISGSLGPLTVVVDQIGIGVFLTPVKGNAGPVDISLGFKPPKGAGLSLDVGCFKGGGFLMLDSEKGEYAGALELDFQGLFSLKAIGIVNTKMPDGSPGFALLILITSEFTPIQLSYGFTLNGVGGLIGLNRTMVVPALVDGIRTNAIKSILFPENVIANITRIISDLKQFFPQQNDHFLIGPMAKLGWGTPPLITVELGLLLDLPNPMFAIVGVLKSVLPDEELPVLRLQVNFIGVVDFEHGYAFFRADLYDSRLLIYTITGSMAFLVSWGEQKTLALSVGGFHPDFRDIPSIPALPDGFRNMARIGISLLADDNPRLKVESYFAVTANTVQFGARVELYAEAAGFNVYGFLGYDVLFQFDPFRFVADLRGGIALREGTSVIAGVSISAKLTGPTPWDARGKASLELLFFSISVGFHATWGDPLLAIATAIEDLLGLLQVELAGTHNWRADLPPNNHLHVSLKKIEPAPGEERLVIHPAGVLTFSQRSLPLEDYVIDKFGNKKPLAANRFKLTNANSRGAMIPADYQSVREQFAPGNFTELSDSDKLSRKSFEPLPSGLKLTATQDLLVAGLPVTRDVIYELSYLRRKRLEFKGLVHLMVKAYGRLVKGSAIRQSALALQQTRTSLNAPAQVVLPQESFVIASTTDLRSHVQTGDGPMFFATQAEAYQRQRELIAANPGLAGGIQVVSHFELNQT